MYIIYEGTMLLSAKPNPSAGRSQQNAVIPGAAATVLCVRMTYKTNHRADRAEESED